MIRQGRIGLGYEGLDTRKIRLCRRVNGIADRVQLSRVEVGHLRLPTLENVTQPLRSEGVSEGITLQIVDHDARFSQRLCCLYVLELFHHDAVRMAKQ